MKIIDLLSVTDYTEQKEVWTQRAHASDQNTIKLHIYTHTYLRRIS